MRGTCAAREMADHRPLDSRSRSLPRRAHSRFCHVPAGVVIPQSGTGAVPGERSSGSLPYLCVLCFVAGLGGLLFGFDTAVISGTIVFLKHQFQLLPSMEGFIVSSGLVGCIAGSLCSGVISDRFGRKRVLLLSGFLFLACSIGCTAAAGVPGIIAFRFVG